MDTQNVVYQYNEIILGNKKKNKILIHDSKWMKTLGKSTETEGKLVIARTGG